MNKRMNVLNACEESATIREEFARRGHSAMSCDLMASRVPGPHYQGNVFDVIDAGWDLMIAHPPCTYLSVSGLHWNSNPKSERFGGRQTEEALEFVRRLMACSIPKWAIENPISCISSRIRKPDQIIQPYDFGDDASKATCLWLKGLPPLVIDPAQRVAGRIVEWPRGSGKFVERWSNQTDSGQNRLGPSETRAQERSATYAGIARAMADQWG